MLRPTSGSETTQTPDELAQLACGPDLHKCALARLIDQPDQSRNLVLADFIRRFAENPRAIGLPLRAMSFLYMRHLSFVSSTPALPIFFSLSAAASSQTMHAILEVWRNTNACNISMLLLDSAHLLRYTNDDGR